MKNKIVIIGMVLLSNSMLAQQENRQFIHKHLVLADASIVAGNMFKSGSNNVYLNGNLEYYLDNKVSVRGDANWMAGTQNKVDKTRGLNEYYSVLLGCAFHLPSASHFDPYFILQPGLAYTASFETSVAVHCSA